MDIGNVPVKQEVRIGAWLGEAWELSVDKEYIGLQLLIGAAATLALLLLKLTVIGAILLYLPVLCGLFYFCKLRIQGRPATFDDTLKGFEVLAQGLLAGVILVLIAIVASPIVALAVALTLCLIPVSVAIVVGMLYALFIGLLPGLLLDRRMAAWDAIMLNARFALATFWPGIGFHLILVAIIIVSALLAGLGLIFTIPYIMFAYTLMYRDWIGFSDEGQSFEAPYQKPEEPPEDATIVSEEEEDSQDEEESPKK